MIKKIDIKKLKAKISYEELYDLYITQNKTKRELLEYYGITTREFEYLLRAYKINKSEYLKLKINELKDKVIELYINQNKTLLETAEILNTSFAKIEVIVYNHNIRKTKEKLYQTRVKGRRKYKKTTGYSCPFKNPSVREKYKEKTGYDSPQRNPKIRIKTKSTNLEKYGSTTVLLNENVKEQSKKTILKKYGVDNISQSEIIKNKKKDTTLKHYGVENPFQADLNKEKIKKTNLERYGTENPTQNSEIREKQWATKKVRGNTNTSRPEDQIAFLLKSKFHNVERQYKSNLYPFACDFYIPSLNLYIEFQGNWTHGKEAYDQNNIDHLKLVNKWKKKVKDGHKYYKGAIDVWTVRDPLKRETAKKNGLNWIEFFSLDEFLSWFRAQSGTPLLVYSPL